MNTQKVLKGLDAAYARGDRKAIEKYLKDNMFQADLEHDYGTLVMLQNEMIGLCRTQSRYQEGYDLFGETRQLISDMGLAGTVPYAGTLINGATLCRAAGWLDRAAELYEEAKNIYERELAPDDFRLAGFYNNLSLLKMDQGEFAEARKYMERALGIIEKIPDTISEQATNHTNIANLCLKTGEYDLAEKHLMAARDLFAREERDPHLASCLYAQGQLAMAREDTEAAIRFYLETREEIVKYNGKNRAYVSVCHSLAQAYRRMGDERKAEEADREAEEIRRQLR